MKFDYNLILASVLSFTLVEWIPVLALLLVSFWWAFFSKARKLVRFLMVPLFHIGLGCAHTLHFVGLHVFLLWGGAFYILIGLIEGWEQGHKVWRLRSIKSRRQNRERTSAAG